VYNISKKATGNTCIYVLEKREQNLLVSKKQGAGLPYSIDEDRKWQLSNLSFSNFNYVQHEFF
jgi:hypothetical protein